MNLNRWPVLFTILSATLFSSCQNNKEKITGNSAAIIDLYNKVNIATYRGSDSLDYYVEKINSAVLNHQPEYIAMAHIAKGLGYAKKSFYQQSFKEYNTAVELLKHSAADSLKARAYTGIAGSFKNRGQYAEAMDNYLTALRLYQQLKHGDGIAGVYSSMAQIHQMKGEMETAKTYIRQVMQMLDKQRYENPYIFALHTLANLYGMSGQLDSALLIDKQGIAISDSIASLPLKSMFLDNKANCYSEKGMFDSAVYYFKACLQIDSSYGSTKQMSDTYLNLGGMYARQKKYTEATQNLQHAIQLAKQVHYLPVLQNGWAQLAALYSGSNNLISALRAKDSAAAYKDSIISVRSETKISELKEVYESEQKQQTILLQQSQLSRQKITIAAIILLSAAVLLAGYSYYRRYKINQQQRLQQVLHEQQQKATIDILTAEEQERKRIAGDLHDGVGQLMTAAWLNLQAANAHAQKENNEQSQLINKTLQLVDESCKEVRAISHNMMPNALTKKGLISALREFIQQVNTKNLQVNLQAEEFTEPVSELKEAVLYRIIQESVNNVIKHAAATSLDISINQDEKGVDIMIEDNGKGFDINEAIQKDGIGLNNIKSRVQYLGGTVEWNSSDGNGTLVAIYIPA
ncbi:MAG: tetratricopeptide repeat protein [Ferruginibacter sp.]